MDSREVASRSRTRPVTILTIGTKPPAFTRAVAKVANVAKAGLALAAPGGKVR